MRNQEKHLEQSVALVKAGIRPDIDMATVRTALANARVQLVSARNNYAVSQAQLAQAMGVELTGAFTLADDDMPAIAGEDGAAGPLTTRALEARPELGNIASQRRAQELTVDSLRGGYGPSLGAVANAIETGSALDRLIPNWYVGLTLNWGIFQGGYTHGQVREAKGTLMGLAGQAAALRLQVEVDVEQAPPRRAGRQGDDHRRRGGAGQRARSAVARRGAVQAGAGQRHRAGRRAGRPHDRGGAGGASAFRTGVGARAAAGRPGRPGMSRRAERLGHRRRAASSRR